MAHIGEELRFVLTRLFKLASAATRSLSSSAATSSVGTSMTISVAWWRRGWPT